MAAGLFAPARPRNEGQQAAFLQFKALTVPLLEAAQAPPSAAAVQQTVTLLFELRTLLIATSTTAFTPALANYIFFPLSSLLQPRPDGAPRSDRLFEVTMQALSALVKKWRAAGMKPGVRSELWIMAALQLGGPLDPKKPAGPGTGRDKGKGKQIERTEETSLAMVELLQALMEPDEETQNGKNGTREGSDGEDDPLGDRIDWSAPDPTAAPPKPAFTPPPVPILFHTLTTLLSLASDPTSLLELQLSSLAALRTLLFIYLARPSPSSSIPSGAPGAGPSPLLATALPGTASTLSCIALSKPKSSVEAETSTRRQASAVVVSALEILSQLLVEAVGDAVTAKLRGNSDADELTGATLEELVSQQLAFSPSISGTANLDDPSSETSAPPPAAPTGPTLPTPSWLRFTLTSISTLLSAVSPLATHPSADVRTALVSLLASLLASAILTLSQHPQPNLLSHPVELLLALSSDSWPSVFSPARSALVAALARTKGGAVELITQIAQRKLMELPRALRRADEAAVQQGSAVVRAALEVLPPGGEGGGMLQGVEKLSWGLLRTLEIERIAGAGQEGGAEGVGGRMALAWIMGSNGAAGREGSTAGRTTAFPPVWLRGVEEETTVESLEALWAALGKAAMLAEQEGELVDLLVGTALGPRRVESSAESALWVLDGVLRGMSGGGAARKALRKTLRRTVKGVLGLLEELEVEEEPEGEEQVKPSTAASSRTDLIAAAGDDDPSVTLIELKKGVVETPSLDKYSPAVAAFTSRENRASHILLLTAFSLRLLSTTATLLSTSFQPFLMQALYHVLAHFSPTTHPFLRAHAEHTLSLISEATGHASPQDLVLSNVDYVVNSVSQRLSVCRLEPTAPLVLVEMIRLVGKPIVPMVQDLVDDVFEALDDYHGYDEVTVGLWAVLDALLKVMEEDLPERMDKPKKDVVKADPAEDFAAFENWVAQRRTEPEKEDDEDNFEEINPQRPFGPGKGKEKERGSVAGETEEGDDPNAMPPDSDDQVIPPTRPQVITAQILSKALYFLSHSSPFLRARVLSLIASAVPLLSLPNLNAADPKATRSSDLLPVIHRAWPFILNRLSPSEEPYVLVEAAGLVEALASHVGEFMSRRILEDVWPRFRTLHEKQEKADATSALSGSSATKYSTSHRLYRSILRTLLYVAKDVPLKEAVLWEQAVLLRRFLSVKVDPELQSTAMKLYEALGEVNPDAVWLVLAATVGAEEGMAKYLRMEGVEFGTNVERLLAGL
ncbi:hypothetical protein JCM8547_002609 [Rhodosporidiobolus lusitaniae]